MNILVCVKRVPNVSEAEIRLASGARAVDLGRLTADINDADSCAVEEAVRIKEAHGGTVRTVTIGPAEDDVMIRMALARGCDSALRIECPPLAASTSPLAIARILAAAIRQEPFDLVLTGAMASDAGNMAVGVALAAQLGVRHAAMVKRLEMGDGCVRVVRELEGGSGEVLDVGLPAVLTIQTGINKPRYAQILGIRAAQKKELRVKQLDELGPSAADPQAPDASARFEKFHFPQVQSKAEYVGGDAAAKVEATAQRIEQWGVL